MTNGKQDEPSEDSLKLNERLTIVLKEYDALRKEAEQSIALMPELGKSVGIVIAGALIGLKADLFANGIAVCIPVLTMGILAAFANTQAKLELTSRRLMEIENHIFVMANEALLVHETRMNQRRLKRGSGRWLAVGIIGTGVYFALTSIVFNQFWTLFAVGGHFAMWVSLYWILAAAMGTYGLWSAWRIADGRKKIHDTELLEWVKSHPSPAYQ